MNVRASNHNLIHNYCWTLHAASNVTIVSLFLSSLMFLYCNCMTDGHANCHTPPTPERLHFPTKMYTTNDRRRRFFLNFSKVFDE